MYCWIWKGLIIVGLGMTLTGLLCMIQAKIYRTPDGNKFYSTHADMNPEINKVGWVLMIGGYIYQILGVIAS